MPGERAALATEFLLQQHQYRQNMAMLHGLPMPDGPVMVNGGTQEPAPVDRMVEAVERTADAIADVAHAPANTTADAIDRAADLAREHLVPAATAAVGSKSNKWDMVKKGALLAALLLGGASIPFVGGLGASMLTSNPAPAVAPAEPVDDGSDILKELEKKGYNVAPTDLGEDIKRAFKLRPELRDQLMRDVQQTLEANGGGR